MQLPLFSPVSIWQAPRLEDLPSWRGAKRVAFDLETRDPDLKTLGPGVRRDPHTNYVVGFSFALDESRGYYIPLRHLGGDNVENPEQYLNWLRRQAANFEGELILMNGSYDLDWCSTLDVSFPLVKRFRDIMLGETVLYELHHSYSMASILERRRLPPKDETMLIEAARDYKIDPKSGMWQLPARFVGLYGEADAVRPLQVYAQQEKEIAEQDINGHNLQNIWDLESDLLPVLVRVRQRGVRIDFQQLDKVVKWSIEQETEALQRVYDSTGYRIDLGNVWKAGVIAPALERIGITLPRTAKTNAPQIDKVLLSGDHPVLQALGWARKVNKLRTTFAESIYRHAIGDRIHCTLVQMAGEDEAGGTKGARFGRMSCIDPNLQQQPSRESFAKMWRSIYVPELGMIWCCADISQQEPRWAAHFAHLVKLPGAAEMVRRYNEDPNTDNHTLMAEITGLDRKEAKIVGLGIMYGEGGYKLCKDLGHPTTIKVRFGREVYDADSAQGQKALELGGKRFFAAGPEGQRILDRYNENAPFVRKLSTLCKETAEKRGFIRTVLGRRCRFPADENGNPDWTYRALNRLIQGSSADQMKKAMIEVDRAGHYLQLQVHDELDGSITDEAEGQRIGEIIRDVVPASVPFKVDVETGPSWGEAK